MTIRAVVFDVGNVLELSQDNYVFDDWAASHGLTSAEFAARMQSAGEGGDVGTVTLEQVHRRLGAALGIDDARVNELMERMWREYLGTANTTMIDWARSLRPRYMTGIVSNSFVGAREREQAAYGYIGLHRRPRLFPRGGPAQARSADLPAVLPAAWRPARRGRLHRQPRGLRPAARDVGMHAVHFTGDNATAIAEMSALLAG